MMKIRPTSATLSEILGVAVEYDLHLKPNEFIQYLDLYSTYISLSESVTETAVESPATFFEFITSQSLLELASSMTTIETGERLIAPAALKITETSLPEDTNLFSGN
jgi:hypothetical protein